VTDEDMSVYTREFYEEHRDPAHDLAYRKMAEAITLELHPQTVIDVGCGVGGILSYMSPIEVVGVEHPLSLEFIKDLSMIPIDKYLWYDLADKMTRYEWGHYDLAICVEVAEHLPRDSHFYLVQQLAILSDTVFFSGAVVGQGGTGHISEAPSQYWDSLFDSVGYSRDVDKERELLDHYTDYVGSVWWYRAAKLYVRRK
jgi:SAM-dependent methyltransferase